MIKPVSSRLPMRVSAQILLARRVNDEPLVVLMVHGVGTTSAYEFRDDDGRDYVCKWENKLGAHVIRVPASLWTANNHRMAKACMERRKQQFPLVVSVELAERSAGAGSAEVVSGHADALPVTPVEVDAPDFGEFSEPAAVEPVVIGGVALAHIISAAVEGGAMRVKSLVATIGGDITEDQIRAAVVAEGSGLTLKNGWVAIAES